MSALLVMACSGAKRKDPDVALTLYQGVMYQTFRANVGNTPPAVVILSAEYGLIDSRRIYAPYDRRMDRARSDAMIDCLSKFDHAAWPTVDEVMLAGGELYKRVMRAALAKRIKRGILPADVRVRETMGGIGYQRSQLGTWLRMLRD